MTVRELYKFFEEKIPRALSCDWDNDGLMVCANDQAEVKRVLVALDITAAVAQKAVDEGYDLIVSHHPLIFRPIKAVAPGDAVANKVIKLLVSGVSAMSFHTRLDAVEGGVNDVLANSLGLCEIVPFGKDSEEMGRIGTLAESTTLRAFAERVKNATGADRVQISNAGKPVSRVALLGGGGAGEVAFAAAAGADTYLTGELKHDQLTEAPERGMNLIMGGHFYTENLVCDRIRALLLEADGTLTVDVVNSYPAEFV
ncbi:MAG: Nif3-like dinuclear metal center hexameric protein [Clostridia bacterium]|nr:Nif3-like dinuclear metal center hexameric protein [Clostridia bacterium]